VSGESNPSPAPRGFRIIGAGVALAAFALLAFLGLALAVALTAANGNPKPLLAWLVPVIGMPVTVAARRRSGTFARRITTGLLLLIAIGFALVVLIVAFTAMSM
jgi:hypothetical protein